MRGKNSSSGIVVLAAYIAGCLLLGIPVDAGTILVDLNDPGCVSGSGQADPYAVVYCAIEDAVADSVADDVIYVGAGSYTPAGGRIIINKSITLAADPALSISGPHPQARPVIHTNSTTWSGCGIQMDADNVVLDGFEIENTAAGALAFYIVGDYNIARNGWTVRNCDIHDGRNGIRVMGDNVTIEYNNIHETQTDQINGEYGNCYGLTVRYNWLHSHHSDLNGKPAGITYNCSSTSPGAWADVDISYNYCWANRTFIDFQHNGGIGPANIIHVFHNTVDWWIGALPDPIQSSDPAQQMSLAWWTDSGTWNGPNFDLRDNLFTRQKYYAVVDTDALLSGQITIDHSLFWQWYLLDAYYPAYAYPNEWPGTRGAVGWNDMGPGNEFVMTNCIHDEAPGYAETGTLPDEYYALSGPDSPAYQAASDGTNMGAWQGVFPPTPTPTELPTLTPTETPTSGPLTATPTTAPLPSSSPAGNGLLLMLISAALIVSFSRKL